MTDHVPMQLKNDYSFPSACTIRFQFAAKGSRPALDIFWYDGSLKPPTPEELGAEAELDPEGMMFVGDKGKILAGFRGETPRIVGTQNRRPGVRSQRAGEQGRRRLRFGLPDKGWPTNIRRLSPCWTHFGCVQSWGSFAAARRTAVAV